MPWRGYALVAVLASAGCNALLDLRLPPNVDRDSDNRRDVEDNCPAIANPDQSDFDADGVGDACDVCDDGGPEDADNDGIADGCDGCIANGEDVDADGVPDNCDQCVGNGEDADHDSIPDNCDACVASGIDKDNDGKDDACDDCVTLGKDVDGDAIDDGCDECIGTFVDTDGDGSVDTCNVCAPVGADTDGDGIDDGCDACMNTNVDKDKDGIDDGCDSCVAGGFDNDLDGVDDACDPCPSGPQHDEDADGYFDACDDCKAVYNPAQSIVGPFFDDYVGDACDAYPADPDLEIFDPFTSQSSQWFVQGSGWSVANDQLLHGGTAPAYRMWGAATPPFSVTTQAVVNKTSWTIGSYWVFIADATVQPALQPSAPRVECVVSQGGSGPALGNVKLEALYFDNDPAVAAGSDGPYLIPTLDTAVTLTVSEKGDTFTCTAGGTTTGPVAITTSTNWMGGIGVKGFTAAFDYYDIITRE